MIEEMTRGHIRLRVGDRTVTVGGEMLLSGHGSPNYVIYLNSIRAWDVPNAHIAIDEAGQLRIIDLLREEMRKRNMSIEIE